MMRAGIGKWPQLLFFYVIPVALWMALIYYLSDRPQPDIPLPVSHYVVSKLAHVGEYLVLMVLILRGLQRYQQVRGRAKAGGRLPGRLVALIALVLVIGYAASDEWHQAATPTRHPSLADVGIDSLGALLGLLLYRRLP